ncbi:hypothetical protein NA78x_000882 [Anatilimnocola sp. NA78]|uniref:hypothetical protein n=1 Tax=Anatilimnocola sp. NA78 TaxID=3415683 RepID=UPI003CE4EAFD
MRPATLLLSAALALATFGLAAGEDFRIDTELFIGSAKEPFSENLTIFNEGEIYDFLLTNSEEITVFEPRQGKLTLLDVKRQLKATMDTKELLEAALSLQAKALEETDAVFRAAAKPEFIVKHEAFKENGNKFTRLKLEAKVIQYTAVGEKPRHPDAARDFRYFADWYARLNSVRGNLPAGARLELNAAIFDQGLLPLRIERVVQSDKFHRKAEVHSKHLIVWRLSGEDQKRIEQAQTYMVSDKFTLVTFDQYCRAASGATAQQVRPAVGQQAGR